MEMEQILECVPNFSEGQNKQVIASIVDAIASVDEVQVLHTDSNEAANRTVVTFVGMPKAVVEAAFRAVQKASELIDMQKHKGEHPRFGATDVLPLIPIKGITMDEAVKLARELAQRIGNELNISVYCYENAAFRHERKSLAYCRKGEYEALATKMQTADGKPDFGPETLNVRSGAIAVGARNILIAYNVNLNTLSAELAGEVAADVRESGRIVRRADGSSERVPGTLSSVRAIGWYIRDFRQAQVSINITDVEKAPLHKVFDEVQAKAQARGLRATGSEIVGLVPLACMLQAGKHYLQKQGLPTDVSEEELIWMTILSLGLNDVYAFRPEEKIIEYAMTRNIK